MSTGYVFFEFLQLGHCSRRSPLRPPERGEKPFESHCGWHKDEMKWVQLKETWVAWIYVSRIRPPYSWYLYIYMYICMYDIVWYIRGFEIPPWAHQQKKTIADVFPNLCMKTRDWLIAINICLQFFWYILLVFPFTRICQTLNYFCRIPTKKTEFLQIYSPSRNGSIPNHPVARVPRVPTPHPFHPWDALGASEGRKDGTRRVPAACEWWWPTYTPPKVGPVPIASMDGINK